MGEESAGPSGGAQLEHVLAFQGPLWVAMGLGPPFLNDPEWTFRVCLGFFFARSAFLRKNHAPSVYTLRSEVAEGHLFVKV